MQMTDKFSATTRRDAVVLGLAAGASLLTPSSPAAVRHVTPADGGAAEANGANGFDFLIGD
jgi:hypothetical protein